MVLCPAYCEYKGWKNEAFRDGNQNVIPT